MEEVEACELIHPKDTVNEWIPARKLDIHLIKDEQCWRWTKVDSTVVAELLKVRVLDIKGSSDGKELDTKTLYGAFIVFKLRDWAHGLEHLKASVNGKAWPVDFRPRQDGWIEIKLGEFFKKCGEVEILMELCDKDQHYWKSGLLVKGIEVRPT